MPDEPSGAKKATRALGIFGLIAGASTICGRATADIFSGGPLPQPTLAHELFLVLVGGVLGGVLGPVFQILDGAIGITPGVKQQRKNYAVQRDIAASLRTLVRVQAARGTEGDGDNRKSSRE